MKKTKSGYTLTAKDLKKLSDAAVIKAIFVDGKWVTVFNKLQNKTTH